MAYVDEGQKVLACIKGRWVPCVVKTACGTSARVVNEMLGIDTWRYIGELKEGS